MIWIWKWLKFGKSRWIFLLKNKILDVYIHIKKEIYEMTKWPKSKFANSNGYISKKICIFEPKFVKPKCVLETKFFTNFLLFVYNFQVKLRLSKHIFALPTWSKKCTITYIVSELYLIELANFDLGSLNHPFSLKS